MKKPLALLLMFSAAACFGQVPSQERQIGEALQDFGSVSGGLYLDQQCHVLSEADAAALKADAAFIQAALAADIGTTGILDTIQDSARKVAGSDKYSNCGVDSQMIIQRTAAHARNWSGQIRKIKGSGV